MFNRYIWEVSSHKQHPNFTTCIPLEFRETTKAAMTTMAITATTNNIQIQCTLGFAKPLAGGGAWKNWKLKTETDTETDGGNGNTQAIIITLLVRVLTLTCLI